MQRMLINQHSFVFHTYKKIEKYFMLTSIYIL